MAGNLGESKEKGDTSFAGAASAVSSFFCGDLPKENGELEEPKENGDCVVAFGSSAATVFASSSFFGLEEPKEKGETGFAVAASALPSFFCGETEDSLTTTASKNGASTPSNDAVVDLGIAREGHSPAM